MKYFESANSVDLDEGAHQVLPNLHLRCLPLRVRILNMIQLGQFFFLNFADVNFTICITLFDSFKVVVVLSFYVHGKHLRSRQDDQLT